MSDDGLRFERRDPAEPPPASPAWRRDWRIPALIGVGVAIALGVGVGFWARPNLDAGKGPAGAMTAAADTTAPLKIVPGEAPSAPPETAGGKLEVLPPDMAAAANARAPVAPTQPAPYAEDSGAPAATVAPAQPPMPQAYPQPAPQAAPPPQAYTEAYPPRARMADRCAGAASLADQMVCQDPRLASADREMVRAYRRAMASGAPRGQVQAEQRDFAMIREDAARQSPRALLSAYDQRIEELNAIADDAGEDGPGL